MKSNSANEALLHLRRFLQMVRIHFVLELISEKVKKSGCCLSQRFGSISTKDYQRE